MLITYVMHSVHFISLLPFTLFSQWEWMRRWAVLLRLNSDQSNRSKRNLSPPRRTPGRTKSIQKLITDRRKACTSHFLLKADYYQWLFDWKIFLWSASLSLLAPTAFNIPDKSHLETLRRRKKSNANLNSLLENQCKYHRRFTVFICYYHQPSFLFPLSCPFFSIFCKKYEELCCLWIVELITRAVFVFECLKWKINNVMKIVVFNFNSRSKIG